MKTFRYDGPCDPVDFSQAVDKPLGTEGYVFKPGGVYTLTEAEYDTITDPVNHPLDHRFTVITKEEAKVAVKNGAPSASS